MKRIVLHCILALWLVVALLIPQTAPRAATDWEVAGYSLNETQQIWLDYIADYVLPQLTTYYGSREQALDSAAVVAWWTLTEGVLGFKQDIHPKNPVSYSNCDGVKTQSATEVCTGNNWQIGIGAIQSPISTADANADIPGLEDILLEGYPGQTVESVLRMISQHAGYAANGATENAIVDSSGPLRAAWLNRVGVVSFVQQYPTVIYECWEQCKSWCFQSCGRGSWSETDKWAPNRAQAEAAIADLRDLIDQLETNVNNTTIDKRWWMTITY